MNPLAVFRDQILQFAIALNEKPASAFDRSVGKDEGCLSPRRIVQVIQVGASPEDLEHLNSCRVCRKTLARLEGKRLEPDPDFVARAMKEANEASPTSAESSPRKEPQLLAAVLGTGAEFVRVGDESGKDVHLVLNLIPVFRATLLRRLVENSLRVSGAFSADNGKIDEFVDLDGDSAPDSLRISFASGQLAARVREAIRHHRRVIDTVEVRGKFEGSEQELVGRTTLEFRE